MRKRSPEPVELTECDASGVSLVRLVETPPIRVTLVRYEPGGVIGEHPAGVAQLFQVVDGRGWVSGASRERIRILAGEQVVWERGEAHASGSSSGMVAIIVQSDDPDAFGDGS